GVAARLPVLGLAAPARRAWSPGRARWPARRGETARMRRFIGTEDNPHAQPRIIPASRGARAVRRRAGQRAVMCRPRARAGNRSAHDPMREIDLLLLEELKTPVLRGLTPAAGIRAAQAQATGTISRARAGAATGSAAPIASGALF